MCGSDCYAPLIVAAVWMCRDIFRVFDSLNYIDNLRFGIDAVRHNYDIHALQTLQDP